MSEHITVDAQGLTTAEAYRLIIGCVTPRPIAWITTMDAAGCVNAAPFSSFNYVSHSPPMLAVNIGARDGKLKDTARNIVASGEFVVNIATEADMEIMHQCSAEYAPGVSEVAALGIAVTPSTRVRVPRIASSPIQMECKLEHAIKLGRGINTLYIGEVLAFHLAPEIYDGHNVDSVKLRPIARMGGPYYAALGEIFQRPALGKPPQ
jgi:flavin reductase (DIM6/NTAB) family NADH-FMN oxidoreductase RutF